MVSRDFLSMSNGDSGIKIRSLEIGFEAATINRGRSDNHQGCLVLNHILLFVLVLCNHKAVAQHTTLSDATVDTPVLGVIDLSLVVVQGSIKGQVVCKVTALHHCQTMLGIHLEVEDVGVA